MNALNGKVALVVGVANENSIAWGIAREMRKAGAQVVMTYQNEKTRRFTEYLSREVEAVGYLPLDLCDEGQVEALPGLIGRGIDIVVHAVAFAPRTALFGRVLDVTLEDFNTTLNVSSYSLIRLVKAVEPLLNDGASVMTVSYLGAVRTVRGYGVMCVGKAALEAIARCLAAELGTRGVTVNVLSPGPISTRAASGVPMFDRLLQETTEASLTKKQVTLEDCGKAAVYLAQASSVSGQTIYVDGGFSMVGVAA